VLQPGTLVGNYRIESAIGRGGMGVVYEATQLSLNRRIALKVLRQDLAGDQGFVERFRQEGRAQALLDHPHVLPVYEAGESELGLFLAMRLVRGATLAELLREGLAADRALRLLGHVASALDAAHAAGLVHRDVKPQNVLVDDADEAYLADFGLTRIGDGSAVTGTGAVTTTGPMLGTVSYLAPEVIRGERATGASDRYAFAAVLFECLAGSVVFPRSSDVAVLYAHTGELPPRISDRRPELPTSLDEVLLAGLAKDPAGRPATAGRLVADAAATIGRDALQRLGPPPPESVQFEIVPGVESAPRRAPRHSGVRGRLVAVAVLLAAVISFFLGRELRAGVERGGAPPRIPAGARPLGSDLEQPGTSLDCNGRRATPASAACSIVQSALPGRTLVASENGAIYAWSVRGARGELALQVFRERDGAFQVALSQYEVASDESVHRFETNLPIRAGDFVGVELSHGAQIGTRRVAGATTKRWFPPKRGRPPAKPDRGPGTGLDVEILLRVDYFPGAEQHFPHQSTGGEAVALPPGHEISRQPLRFQDGSSVDVAVVELGDAVVLDLFRREQRAARIDVPGLRSGGKIVDFYTTAYDEPAGGETGITWLNPNSARVVQH
jgi:hypothetical protein